MSVRTSSTSSHSHIPTLSVGPVNEEAPKTTLEEPTLQSVEEPTLQSVEEPEQKRQKKLHRFRPGTVALREIRNEQRSTDLVFPKTPFQRLVREITQDIKNPDMLWSAEAMEALQVASEAFLIEVFQDANELAIFRDCETIEPRDMQMALKLRRDHVMH